MPDFHTCSELQRTEASDSDSTEPDPAVHRTQETSRPQPQLSCLAHRPSTSVVDPLSLIGIDLLLLGYFPFSKNQKNECGLRLMK